MAHILEIFSLEAILEKRLDAFAVEREPETKIFDEFKTLVSSSFLLLLVRHLLLLAWHLFLVVRHIV